MRKLSYIYHDCFVYEDSENIIVFDYWKDPTKEEGDLPEFIKEGDKRKRLTVMVSHHHKDHFNKEIFEWDNLFRETLYVLSKDTARLCRHILRKDSLYHGPKPAESHVIVLGEGEKAERYGIRIEAFGSTDIGNSYAVETGGRIIFHAGDLNAWIWKDESSEEEVKEETVKFERIADKIAESYPIIDICMFPVDGRIRSEYYRGAKIFVRKTEVRRFFPMHFELGETAQEELKYKREASAIELYAHPERGEYICMTGPYSCWIDGNC